MFVGTRQACGLIHFQGLKELNGTGSLHAAAPLNIHLANITMVIDVISGLFTSVPRLRIQHLYAFEPYLVTPPRIS